MGESSIVIELQRMASDSTTSVAELLRKALIVATKLKLSDFKQWIDQELNTYRDKVIEIPQYRRSTSQMRAWNPYRGWIPVSFETAEDAATFSAVEVRNSIAELEEMASSGEKSFILEFHPAFLHHLMQGMGGLQGMKPQRVISANVIFGILGAVRNTVLQWALKLEEEGILGEGMTFSDHEKKKAASSPTIHIAGDFKGVVGDVSGHNVQIGDYGHIHQQLKDAGVSQSERNELENILDEFKKAPVEKREPLAKRATEWVARNGDLIGSLGTIIMGWFVNHP
jgi:hypothetical protein